VARRRSATSSRSSSTDPSYRIALGSTVSNFVPASRGAHACVEIACVCVGVPARLLCVCTRHTACDVIGNTDSPPDRRSGADASMSTNASAPGALPPGPRRALRRRRSTARSRISAPRTASIPIGAVPLVLRASARTVRAALGAGARAVPLGGARRVLRPDALPEPRALASRVRLQVRRAAAASAWTHDRARPRGDPRSAARLGVRRRPPLGFLRRENALNG
jgi:hypothetical protein